MYAKLVFNVQTPVAGKVRDIARLINDSYSGNADLSNLEFIDVGNSELINTVNSGWQVVGSSIPAAGTALSTDDSNYYLEGTCVDTSKKKYASVHVNFDFTSSTIVTNHSDIGVVLSTVIDYGTATELFTEGHSSTNTTYARYYGVGNSVASEIIYLFVTPEKIIIIGSGYNSIHRPSMYAYLEFEENEMTKKHSLSPTAKLNSMPNSYGLVSFTGGFFRGDFRFFNNLEQIQSYYYFPQSLYDTVSRIGAWRVLGFTSNEGYSGISSARGCIEDGTTTGTSISAPLDVRNYVGKFDFSFYEPKAAFGDNESISSTPNEGKVIDASGNFKIPIIPLVCNITSVGTGIIDFSMCNIYKTVGNLGAYSDEVTINNDTYFYFTADNISGALIIKKE